MQRYTSPTPPRTNQNWPDGFGFRIGGNAPVIITHISENSFAQKSGLRPGDQLLEVDGVNVQNLSKDNVILLARQSRRVPPALCVISRIRNFVLRRRRGTFGFKVRGGGPVFVSQLEERGPAKVAGIRLGDMLVEVNNTSVRDMTYIEVERLVNTSGSVLQLVLIAGVKSIEEIEKRNTASRFRRAREFFQEMNYYLAGEDKKKSQLVKLLNKFAKDKSVETLARGIMKILETPVQKRLIPTIKQLIPRDKRKIFTDILQDNQTNVKENTEKGLVRSASFEEQLNFPAQSPQSPEVAASKYRTWSKGSRSPTKPSTPRSAPDRPSSMMFQNDFKQATFQRSYSASATLPRRRSPEIYGDRTMQNLADTFRFQMNQFLTRGEQLVLKQRLKEYHMHRNAQLLVLSLEPILDDREKLKMVPYLSQLLPENEQYAFDKEAQKLMEKYLQGSSSEGPDVIDIAYRVQGVRLAELPQPKNLIGGMQGDLDVIPVKETPNSTRSNESSTVAALLTAAENTNFAGKTGNTITVEALVHSEKRDTISETDLGGKLPTPTVQSPVGNATQNIANDNAITTVIPTDQDEPKGKVEIKARSTHSDLSSAIDDKQRKHKTQAPNEDLHPPAPESGRFVPPAPPPPPPPPPPPGINTGGKDTLPKMQLKRVNWEKLGIAGLENTVWGQLGRNDPLDQLEDFVELEQQFSSAKQTKAPKVAKKQETIEILEPRKQYNMAILLGHLKRPHEEIKRAVLSMDETKLSEAHVKQLLLYAPDHKEIQKYKHFADDEEKLGQCDKFSLMVSKIPGYKHRLKAMLFKANFSDKLEEIKPELERVVKASQELRESKKLQQVLQLVLAFGNYMNQGNARIAGASAFRVGFLAKLSSTKTSDNKSNLLKFLVKTVEAKCPEVLDLKSELTSISLAARVSYQIIKEEIDEVVKTMEDVKTDLEQHGSQIPENDEDKFADIMGTFVENSKKDMDTLLAIHDQMKSEYTKTAKFFGEDPTMTTTEEFFGIFSTFLDQFENARLELVNQKKRKEEQAKREIEKQNRLKKKKDLKSPSSSVEELEESNENKSELAKQQENILTKKRENYAHRSDSSESDVPVSPGLALSHEMRKNQLFKSHERLDEKKSPPPVLPKPKPKPKPKLPPVNKNPATAIVQPINSHAMQEIANEISQMKRKNNKKNKLAKASSSDSDSVDGNAFTKTEVKTPPKLPRKPIQNTKSVDFNEVARNTKTSPTHKSIKTIEKSKSHDEMSQSMKDDKVSDVARQNAVCFEEPSDTQGYSKIQNAPGRSREETASTPKEVLLNLKEKGVNLMMNKKRVLSNMCWPLNCQNGSSQDDEDPLYSTVNFATLGYNNSSSTDNIEEYKETSEVNTPQCTNTAFPNPMYSPPNSSPPKTDLSNVVQISTDLGIKDVQSIVKGGTSYTVGDNMDLYSLPVKRRIPSIKDDTKGTTSPEKSPTDKRTSDKNTSDTNTAIVITPDDTYSEPVVSSSREIRNSISESQNYDVAWRAEGPYAQTVLFEQPEDQPESHYDIPDLHIDTAPGTTFDLKPPNFKPPPPPPGGSPTLRKNKKKQNSPVLRNKNKVKVPKKKILKDAPSSKDKTFELGMKRSQSESDLTSEPIFATPSSIGITNEDKNNNRHSMFVTPKEVGKLREYHVYSDEDYEQTNDVESAVSDGKLRHHVGNGRKHIGNHRNHTEKCEDHSAFPAIVPPPPSSTPIIDTDSMVAPPPPHITPSEVVPPHPIYPPPRLHPSKKALRNEDSLSEETRWQEMIESLPPPPPDLLES